MVLSKKMEAALNKQITAEFYSAYLYKAMSAHFGEQNLNGFSNWMHVQALEELTHGNKLIRYIVDRLGHVELLAIDAPKSSWKTPLDAFKDAFKHEQKVTGMINALIDLARAENDTATFDFLQWYIREQVEEETNADENVQKLTMIGNDAHAILFLDQELGKRTFVA